MTTKGGPSFRQDGARILLMIVIAAPLLISTLSCSGGLSFIKKRLPLPHKVSGGYLFQFSSPSAQVVQLCGSWEENNW